MKVKCPTCKKEVEFSSQNKFRPFCSERCSTLDLGAWADEKYRVPVEVQGEHEKDSVNENSDDDVSQSDVGAQDFPSKDELN
jgi:endogenous inhibitor of DNA gyrase (YacG/DUF329 family)